MTAPIPAPRPDRLYDDRCTGFPNGIGEWDWLHCCQAHDLGGSDVELARCVIDATPGLPIAVVLLAVGVMWVARPVYMLGQRLGWWR